MQFSASTHCGVATSCAPPHGTIHRRLVVLRRAAARCLHRPAAARVRESGGVCDKKVDRQAVDDYLRQVDLPQAIAGIRAEARKSGGMRGEYLQGLALCLETMWDLAMEVLGKGKPFPTSVVLSPRPAALQSRRARKLSASA